MLWPGPRLSLWVLSLGWTKEPCDLASVCPAGARVEEFLYEKLDRKVPSRVTNGELLAQYMAEAASELGPTTPYGEPGPQALRPPWGLTAGSWSLALSFSSLPLPSFLCLFNYTYNT